MNPHLRIFLNVFILLIVVFDPRLPVGSQDVIVHWILLVHVTLVVRQDITFRYVRRNKLQYLVHF